MWAMWKTGREIRIPDGDLSIRLIRRVCTAHWFVFELEFSSINASILQISTQLSRGCSNYPLTILNTKQIELKRAIQIVDIECIKYLREELRLLHELLAYHNSNF